VTKISTKSLLPLWEKVPEGRMRGRGASACLRLLIVSVLSVLLASCGLEGARTYAPVSTIEPIPQSGIHRVARGETLYSIAWRYGLDFRSIAKRNGIKSYHIEPGDIIYLRGKRPKPMTPAFDETDRTTKTSTSVHHRSVPPPPSKVKTHEEAEPSKNVTYWQWPVQGPVRSGFSVYNKGVNITGRLGDPVHAAAAGKVVYSGNGLKDYGNLIIIKHNNTFLTAYAYNSANLVKEGEWVKQGQEIATMGNSGANRSGKHVVLHFEIRRNGQPVNPLNYLAK